MSVDSAHELVEYNNGEFAFRHPASWRAQSFPTPMHRVALITYLSTEDLHDPFIRERHADGEGITWGSPLERLSPAAVLVRWMRRPGWNLSEKDGEPLVIGELPARLMVQRDQVDGPFGAQLLLKAVIEGRWGHGVVVCEAYAREPGLSQVEEQFSGMLASVRFLPR